MKRKIIFIFVIVLLLNTNILISVQASNLSKKSKYSNQKDNDTFSENFTMAIISTEYFNIPSLQKLINHKISHGINAFYKDVDEIYDEYPGRDDPEKIKYYIKDAYETLNVSYVFIVGGLDFVPIRKTPLQYWYHDNNPVKFLPTDLYYADIYNSTGGFCSWDANNNNIFGEFEGLNKNIDDADCYADVYVGRIPCFEKSELDVIVDKIIHYENNTYGSEWFNKALMLSGELIYEAESDIIAEEIEKHGFETIKLYSTKNKFNPRTINTETTKGAGLICFQGHGSPETLMVHKELYRPLINWTFQLPVYYRNKHLEGMNNAYKLPIVFFCACSTAEPDPLVQKFTFLSKFINFPNKMGLAYNIVKKGGGGAIASIGATRETTGLFVYSGAGFLCNHFFINYEPGITVSEMFVKAQYDYLDYSQSTSNLIKYEILETFILIGDPSLKVGGYQ